MFDNYGQELLRGERFCSNYFGGRKYLRVSSICIRCSPFGISPAWNLCFTVIVPRLCFLPFCWPILVSHDLARLQLGSKGDLGILLFPSPDANFFTCPPPWNLFAFRVASGKKLFSLFLSQSRWPRFWRPPVPYPLCAYLNDDSFNFCQWCEFRSDPVIVDDARDLVRWSKKK